MRETLLCSFYWQDVGADLGPLGWYKDDLRGSNQQASISPGRRANLRLVDKLKPPLIRQVRVEKKLNFTLFRSFVFVISISQKSLHQTVAPENISFAIKLNLHRIITETQTVRETVTSTRWLEQTLMNYNIPWWQLLHLILISHNFKFYINRERYAWFVMKGRTGSLASG